MSVRDKANNGDYTSKLKWPSGEMDYETRRAMRDAYHEDTRRFELEFRADLEAEYNLARFTQATRDKVFSLAWASGHAAGFAEVVNEYDHIMDLVNLVALAD
jgi:hypothetical protein